VDRERVCDCQFKAACQTFNDPLIDERRKGLDGFGCVQQTDHYRGKHCRVFRCAYLAAVVSDAMRHASRRQV